MKTCKVKPFLDNEMEKAVVPRKGSNTTSPKKKGDPCNLHACMYIFCFISGKTKPPASAISCTVCTKLCY